MVLIRSNKPVRASILSNPSPPAGGKGLDLLWRSFVPIPPCYQIWRSLYGTPFGGSLYGAPCMALLIWRSLYGAPFGGLHFIWPSFVPIPPPATEGTQHGLRRAIHGRMEPLYYAKTIPGRKSILRAGSRPDSNPECLKIGPTRQAGGPTD